MIVPIVTLVLGGVGGYAFGRGRSVARKETRVEQDLPLALPEGASATLFAEPVPYRLPMQALINLPEDEEDFAVLAQALSECLEYLRETKPGGTVVTADELRDCILSSVYPDFEWPPVPGDPPNAQLLWHIVGHEARKTLAGQVAVLAGQVVAGDGENLNRVAVAPPATKVTDQTES